MNRAAWIGDEALHHRPIARDHANPLRADTAEIVQPPRVEDERIYDGHCIAPLRAYLAADIAELERMHALDPNRRREYDQRVQDLGRVEAAGNGPTHDFLDVCVAVVILPGVLVHPSPGLLGHGRVRHTGVLEI